ncbi:MAG: RodZ domain-containing protein [Janthinobacterium lividum]
MKAAHPEVVAGTFAHPGEVLRQAREDKGWSQSDVAVRLNLTVSSLNNLETGAFDKLPGHTFARGYIRAYAKLLGMDQTPLVQAFDQATGTNAQGSNVHGLGRIEEPVRLSHNILRIVSLLLLILVIGGGFLWWQDQAGQRGKDQNAAAIDHVEVEGADGTTRVHPIDEPQVPATAPTATPGQPNALALPQGVPPVDPATTGTPASPASQAATAAPTTGSALPLNPATHAPGAATAPAATVPTTPASTAHVPPANTPFAPSAPAAPDVQAPVAGAGQVNIQFVADCWTQVTDGTGKVLVSGLKRTGDTLDLSGKPPFAVRLGFAKGAQITYNGEAVDVAKYTSGQTARLKLGQ